jgi:hypothetical protein
MKKDFSFPPYWPGLYPIEQKGKIDLFSGSFYDDALKYFCKDGSDKKQLMDCIKIQSYRIENIYEWYEVKAVWERRKRIIEMRMMFRHESIEHIPKKKFVEAVGEILNGIKIYLDQKQTNRDDEMNALKKKAKRDAILIQSLADRSASQGDIHEKTKVKDNEVKISYLKPLTRRLEEVLEKTDGKPDFSNVLLKIKFDKDGATRKKVGDILNEIYERELHLTSNHKDFTAIASILYKTEWTVNVQTFKEWKELLSMNFGRNISTYKECHVQDNVLALKKKYYFLDLP